MKFIWTSFKRVDTPKTVGPVLDVDLPLFGIDNLPAKVDTGAFSGALHATKIREVVGDDGKIYLRFLPLGSHDHTLEVASFHRRRVKSSNGIVARRYAIDTDVRILGQTYPITITLTNRGSMKYQMLIGRRFLQVHGFLVDVSHENG